MKPSTLLIVIEIPVDCLGQRVLWKRWKIPSKIVIFVVKRWPGNMKKILKIKTVNGSYIHFPLFL